MVAPVHIESFLSMDGVCLTRLCDIRQAAAEAYASRYGVKQVSTDYREVLAAKDVDCISICTDHASHAQIAIDALEAGKHVLCEKALAASADDLQAMRSAAARYPNQVFSGVFQHRFDPVYGLVKQWVEQGRFGTLLTAGVQMRCQRTDAYYQADDWRGTWAKEGGSVLMNQAIHYLDILAWVVGRVDSLCGTYANRTHKDSIETEDTAVAIMRFANGTLGTVEASCSSLLHWDPMFFVHGTDGLIEVRKDQATRIEFEDPEVNALARHSFSSAADVEHLPGKSYYGTGHRALLTDFIEAVREGREPFVTAASACVAADLAMAIYQSHHQNKWVTLPNNDETMEK